MSFYIFRSGAAFELTDGAGASLPFPDEATAANEAVRIAQDAGQLYAINYWRP